MNWVEASFLHSDMLDYSATNWDSVKESKECGCYYCAQVFPSSEVKDYEENEKGEKGALCPYCGRKTLLTPDKVKPGAPFSAELMRDIIELCCDMEVRNTYLSDMFKKDKWAYDHWHDYMIRFFANMALNPIHKYIEICINDESIPAEEFSADALNSIVSEIADRNLQQYAAGDKDNSFIRQMCAEIRRTILSKALKYQEENPKVIGYPFYKNRMLVPKDVLLYERF